VSPHARIVLTRQQQRNRIWLQSLVKAGLEVLELPLLQFAELAVPQPYLDTAYDWILFTSPQAVEAFLKVGLKPRGAKLGALGSGTSAALVAAGLADDLGFRGRDGGELAKAFIKQVAPPASVLLPGAKNRLADPKLSLAAAGFQVQELATYETHPVVPSELKVELKPDDILFFCSPSAVKAFLAAFSERPVCVAIGETTATVCRENGFATHVAETPDLNAMVRAAGFGPITIIPENES
jgi:uroporphyrinogen-III synthase